MRAVNHKDSCCWQHLLVTEGVSINPSKAIEGATGLFVNREHKKGDIIGYYDVSRKKLSEMIASVDIKNCKKAHHQCEQFFLRADGLKSECYPMPYKNVAKSRRSNARYAPSHCCKHILLVAKRQLTVGAEVLVEHTPAEHMTMLSKTGVGKGFCA